MAASKTISIRLSVEDAAKFRSDLEQIGKTSGLDGLKNSVEGLSTRFTAMTENARATRRAADDTGASFQKLMGQIDPATAALQRYHRQQEIIASASAAGTASHADIARATDLTRQRYEALTTATVASSSSMSGMGSAMSLALRGYAALATGVVAAGTAIAAAGDKHTAMMQQLASATGSTASAERAYQSLQALAQKTGVSVTESAAAFSRFAIAANDIGATQAQVVQLVGTIQKAGILAGTSTSEANAAVQQLGQALASGKLQGDELRSVMENMPTLAVALAKELGVGVGELRKMGEEGKLTADVVLPALLRGGEKITEEFDRLPPTMSRAFGILGEGMVSFAANLDKSLGLTKAIAAAALAAASAVRTVNAVVAPTEVQAADTAVSRAQARVDRAKAGGSAYLTGGASAAIDPSNPGAARAAVTQSGVSKAELDAATAELREALANRTAIQRDAAELQLAEQNDALARSREAQKESHAKAAKELVLSLDKKAKAQETYVETIKKIQTEMNAGSLTAQQAAHLSEIALAEKTKALLEKTETAKTHTVRAAAAERSSVYEDLVLDMNSGLLVGSAAEAKAAASIKKTLTKAASDEEKASASSLTKEYRDQQSVLNELAGTASSMADQVGTSISNAFANNTPVKWASVAKSALTTVAQEAIKLSLINPFVNWTLGTSKTTAADAVSAISGASSSSGGSAVGTLSSGAGMASSAAKLLGFDVGSYIPSMSTITGSINSWGASTLGTGMGWSAETAAMASTPLAEGVAGPVLSSEAASSMTGSTLLGTAGGVLGGAVGGYYLGSTLGDLVNPGHSDQSKVGAGVGAIGGAVAGAMVGSVVPIVGTALGAIIGGLAGGGGGGMLGSLFGPGAAHNGWGYHVSTTEAGQLKSTDEHYNDVAKEQWTNDMAALAKVNEFMGLHGLKASGESIVGGNNTGVAGQVDQFASTSSAFTFTTDTGSASLKAVLTRVFTSYADLEEAVTTSQVYDKLVKFGVEDQVTGTYNAAMYELATTFDKAAEAAKKYGLSEDELNEARKRAAAAVQAEADATTDKYIKSFKYRTLTAEGKTSEAALLQADTSGAEELASLKATYKALYGDTYAEIGQFQYALAALTDTLATERKVIVDAAAAATIAATTTAFDAYTSALNAQVSALETTTSALKSASSGLRSFVSGLDTTAASPLSPGAQLAAARASMATDLAAARGGDTTAAGRLQSDAQTRLTLAQSYYGAATASYAEEYAAVKGDLSSAANGLDAQTVTQQAQLTALNTGVDLLRQQVGLGDATVKSLDELRAAVLLAAGLTPQAGSAATGAAITAQYQSDLGRAPDAAGMAYWTKVASDTGSTDAALAGIAGSAESKVRQAYQVLLGHAPDPSGLAFWTGQMSSGMSYADVFAAIKGSPEYKASHAAAGGGWIGNGLWGKDSVLAAYAGGGNVALAGGEFVVSAPAAAAYADILPAINRGAYGNDNSSQAVLAELRSLREEVAKLRQVTAQGASATVSAVQQGTAVAANGQTYARMGGGI